MTNDKVQSHGHFVTLQQMSGQNINLLVSTRKLKLFELWIMHHQKKKEIAAEFHIPANTLSTILKNHTAITSSDTTVAVDPKQKIFHSSKYQDVDEALLKWFRGEETKTYLFLDQSCLPKRKSLPRSLGIKAFKAVHDGWHILRGSIK